jgi:hypothetical protein
VRAPTRKGSRRSYAIFLTHEMEGQGNFSSGIGKFSRMTGKARGSERCLSCQNKSQTAEDRQPQVYFSRVDSEESYTVTMPEAYKNRPFK